MNLRDLHRINDGVTYDSVSDTFTFNFTSDADTDIVKLCESIHKSNFYSNTLYYGYEFDKSVDSSVRSKFIHELKFGDGISQEDKDRFIRKVGEDLDREINLASYDVFVVPESSSTLLFDIEKHLARLARPKYIRFELLKSIPKDIEFDYEAFVYEVLSRKTKEGRNLYTEKDKDVVLGNIEKMMEDIHSLDYFSLAKEVKTKYRHYILNYYHFKDKKEEDAFKAVINSNILIFDDVMTSGSTMSLVLKTIESLGNLDEKTNKKTLFSLLGNSFQK